MSFEDRLLSAKRKQTIKSQRNSSCPGKENLIRKRQNIHEAVFPSAILFVLLLEKIMTIRFKFNPI
jgi:hypothetical protein